MIEQRMPSVLPIALPILHADPFPFAPVKALAIRDPDSVPRHRPPPEGHCGPWASLVRKWKWPNQDGEAPRIRTGRTHRTEWTVAFEWIGDDRPPEGTEWLLQVETLCPPETYADLFVKDEVAKGRHASSFTGTMPQRGPVCVFEGAVEGGPAGVQLRLVSAGMEAEAGGVMDYW